MILERSVSSADHSSPIDVFKFSYMKGSPLDRQVKMVKPPKGILKRDIEVQVLQAIARDLRAVP